MKQRNWKVGWNKSPEVWLLLSLVFERVKFSKMMLCFTALVKLAVFKPSAISSETEIENRDEKCRTINHILCDLIG